MTTLQTGVSNADDMEVSLTGADSTDELIDRSSFPPAWAVCVSCKLKPTTPDVVCLPCLHICCSEECTNKLLEQPGASSCPECYVVADKNTVHACAYLNDKLESLFAKEDIPKDKGSHQICQSCVREVTAHRWCEDCQEFLCSFCCEHHQYGKATRGHRLAPTSEGIVEASDGSEASIADRKCQLHSEQVLISFCVDCKAALCTVCLTRHSNHTCKTLEDFSADVKDNFYRGLDHIKFIQEKCEAATKDLEAKLNFILTDQKVYLDTEAKAFFKRLINSLLQREIQVRQDLGETTLAKAKELNIRKAKTNSIVSQCTQYLTTAKEIVDKGSVWNVLRHTHYIENQFKELDPMYEILSDQEKYDNFVEKNWAFHMDKKPMEMAEKSIQLMCQAKYRDTTRESPVEEMPRNMSTTAVKERESTTTQVKMDIHDQEKEQESTANPCISAAEDVTEDVETSEMEPVDDEARSTFTQRDQRTSTRKAQMRAEETEKAEKRSERFKPSFISEEDINQRKSADASQVKLTGSSSAGCLNVAEGTSRRSIKPSRIIQEAERDAGQAGQRTQSRGKEPPAKSSVTKQARKSQPAATDVFTKEEIEEHKNSYSRNTFCPYCDTEFESATDLRQHIRSKCRTLPLTRILQKSHDRVFKPRRICSLHGKGVSLRALDTFLRQLPPRKGTVLAKTDMVLFWNNKCSHPRGKVLRLTDAHSKYRTRNKHQAQIQEITAGVKKGTINRVLFPVTFFTYAKGKGTPVTRGILKQYLNKEHAALLVIERPAPGMDFEPMYYDSVSRFKIFWPKVKGDALRKKLKEIFGHNIPLREEHKHIYHSLTPNGCAAVVAHWVWTALVKGKVQDPEGYAVIDGLKTYLQDSLQVGIPRKNKAVAN